MKVIKHFNELREAPVGQLDPQVERLLGRVERALKAAVGRRDWWTAAKLAAALRDWEFEESVCILCDRFCYTSSLDFAACGGGENLHLVELLDLDPESLPEGIE